VAISARPATELALVGLLSAIGLVAESARRVAGPRRLSVRPAVGLGGAVLDGGAVGRVRHRAQRDAALAQAPAVCWPRCWARVFGPLSFLGGVRLGGARFIDETAALVTLACMWAVLMPLAMWLSDRLDGVSTVPSSKNPDA
jgi:hypothetical protein